MQIIVFGCRRPDYLSQVLESLQRQDARNVHVSIDGSSLAEECARVAITYGYTPEVAAKNRGIDYWSPVRVNEAFERGAESVFVLLDDTFPRRDAVMTMQRSLSEIPNDAFAVIGHRYAWPGEEAGYLGRFTDWGWGTTAEKWARIGAQLLQFARTPGSYRVYRRKHLTPGVRRLLNVVQTRPQGEVAAKGYHCDSATGLVCAVEGLRNVPTPHQVTWHFGTRNSLHIHELRHGPGWNMVSFDELWELW